MLYRGDSISIEKTDDFNVIGTFQKQDDEFIMIKGTVGDNIDKDILVPKNMISQIVVISRKADQRREDW